MQLLLACALALFVGWAFAVCWFFVGGKDGITWGYAVVDAGLAAYFWRMSERKIFPAMLFYLHAFLVAYYLYASVFGLTRWWVAAFTNRIVELALIYVIFGAVIRLNARSRRRRATGLRRIASDLRIAAC